MFIDAYMTVPGWYGLENGIEYDSPVKFIISQCLGDDAVTDEGGAPEFLLKLLKHFNDSQETGNSWEQMVPELFGGSEAVAYVVCNLLENNDIIDSGVSIRRAWLTNRGKSLYKDLSELLKAEEDKKCRFCRGLGKLILVNREHTASSTIDCYRCGGTGQRVNK